MTHKNTEIDVRLALPGYLAAAGIAYYHFESVWWAFWYGWLSWAYVALEVCRRLD